MKISKKEHETLLSALESEIKLPDIEEDEITARMLSATTGLAESTCRRFLNDKVKDGALKTRKVRLSDGKIAFAYSKVV
jgi:Fic family protein